MGHWVHVLKKHVCDWLQWSMLQATLDGLYSALTQIQEHLKAASQLALGCHWLVLEVCLLVGVNDAAVSVSMLDALAAAVISEGVAGLSVLHLPVTVHWRHLMDLD